MTIYAPVEAPLVVFGRPRADVVRFDLKEGVAAFETEAFATESRSAAGHLRGSERRDADRTIALPIPTAPSIDGMPADCVHVFLWVESRRTRQRTHRAHLEL